MSQPRNIWPCAGLNTRNMSLLDFQLDIQSWYVVITESQWTGSQLFIHRKSAMSDHVRVTQSAR